MGPYLQEVWIETTRRFSRLGCVSKGLLDVHGAVADCPIIGTTGLHTQAVSTVVSLSVAQFRTEQCLRSLVGMFCKTGLQAPIDLILTTSSSLVAPMPSIYQAPSLVPL